MPPLDSASATAGADETVVVNKVQLEQENVREREAREDSELDTALAKAFQKAQANGRTDSDDKENGDTADATGEDGKVKRAPDGKFTQSDERKAAEALKAKEAGEEKKTAEDKAAADKKKAEAAKAKAVSEKKDQKPDEKAEPDKEPSPDQQAGPRREPPKSWSAEKKAVWEAMSPEAQEYAGEREQQAHKQISDMGQKLKAFEPLQKVLDANRHVFARHRATPDQGIAGLLQVQDALDRDPRATLRQIAKLYGEEVSFPNEGDDDPDVLALREENRRLKRGHDLARSNAEAQRQLQAERITADNEKLIEDFARDKPDFAELEPEVFRQIRALRADHPHLTARELLERAWERAQWSDEGARKRRLEAEAKKQTEAEAERARSASQAAGLNVGDEEPDPEADEDEDAFLAKAFQKAHRRRAA